MPRKVLRYEFENENLDLFFIRHACNLSDKQKDALPDELRYKLFNRENKFRIKLIDTLPSLAKLFVFVKSLKKKIAVFIEDEKGISEEEYFRLKDSACSEPAANELVLHGSFVLAGKELMDGFTRLNALSVSPQYNYLVKAKNTPESKVAEWKNQTRYIVNFLANYESVKKKAISNSGISVAELCMLFYLYDGVPKVASSLYLSKFKHTYNAGKNQMQLGFNNLQKRGFIEKIGYKKGAQLKIMPLGKSLVDGILKRYFIEF